MNVQDQIKLEEGKAYEAYPDPITKGDPWTIGYGHTGPEVHAGLVWNDEQIEAAFQADYNNAVNDMMAHFPWAIVELTEERRAVLINMIFQMGINKVLKFHPTLELMRQGKVEEVKEHLLGSLWAKQTPARAERLATQFVDNQWATYA